MTDWRKNEGLGQTFTASIIAFNLYDNPRARYYLAFMGEKIKALRS